jgi:HAD superfamily phosphoserine phosphatase-like hydrolase
MKLVLFDFDDTVTMVDTTLLFGVFVAGKGLARYRVFVLLLALMFAKARVLSNAGLKRIFMRLFLSGRTEDELRRLVLEFYQTWLNTLTDDSLLNTLRTHVVNGDRVYLVSANYDFFLQPLVERWSLAGVIATPIEYRAGRCTGRVIGTACHGHEKLRRAVVCFGPTALAEAVAYGNRDDSPLLQAVHTGYLIHRVRPPFPLGLMRRYAHILTGRLSRAELTAAPKIDLFPPSRSLRVATST